MVSFQFVSPPHQAAEIFIGHASAGRRLKAAAAGAAAGGNTGAAATGAAAGGGGAAGGAAAGGTAATTAATAAGAAGAAGELQWAGTLQCGRQNAVGGSKRSNAAGGVANASQDSRFTVESCECSLPTADYMIENECTIWTSVAAVPLKTSSSHGLNIHSGLSRCFSARAFTTLAARACAAGAACSRLSPLLAPAPFLPSCKVRTLSSGRSCWCRRGHGDHWRDYTGRHARCSCCSSGGGRRRWRHRHSRNHIHSWHGRGCVCPQHSGPMTLPEDCGWMSLAHCCR